MGDGVVPSGKVTLWGIDMAQIFELAKYRKQTKAETPTGPVYFCTRCCADLFHLHPSGDIRCVECGAIMRNIGVAPVDRSNAGQ